MRCDICGRRRLSGVRQATVRNMLVNVCPECDPRGSAPAVEPEPAPARRKPLRCEICDRESPEFRQATVHNMPLRVCADRSECDPLTTVEFLDP